MSAVSPQQTTFPWYGRKWKIEIQDASGNTVWDISDSTFEQGPNQAALRVRFKAELVYGRTPLFSEVEIWNFNGDTNAKIIQQGFTVRVSAGFKDNPSSYGVLFTHRVFQPLFDRQNVTDFVTTLECIDGASLIEPDFTATSLAAGFSYNDMLIKMSQNSRAPMKMGYVSPKLRKDKSPRGCVLFGTTQEYRRSISRDNNLIWKTSGTKSTEVDMIHLGDPASGKVLVVSPTTGLIGTPQQVAVGSANIQGYNYGVNFRVFMNSAIKLTAPPMLMKLDQSIIRQMKVQFGGANPPSPTALDKDGTYKVVGVTYVGDTRGNDWYVDVTGVAANAAISPPGKGWGGS